MEFTKMQGLGNDYIYIDATKIRIKNPSMLAKYMSDRHFGVGADGLILILPSSKADFSMRMFNADGSEAEMCGNGIRCVAKFVYDKCLTDKKIITVDTKAGIKTLTLNVVGKYVDTVKVDMGIPKYESECIPVISNTKIAKNLKIEILDKIFDVTCVSMGNPHTVIFVDDVDSFDVKKYGELIEKNEMFPQRTNVEFVEIKDNSNIKMRVWERGTGETLACGTGACASVVACVLNGLTSRNVRVQLLGGNLDILYNDNNHVYMTGPAKTVFEGKLVDLDVKSFI
ncbi:MAG TPA: diaminopimelate epimerase [Firmicutes bacterium]|nr:diaminopimelate epimerase [Bacillota bacterium]